MKLPDALPVSRASTAALLALAFLVPMAEARAQQEALTLGEVELLIRQGVSETRVLDLASEYCIAFRLTASSRNTLVRAGASSSFLNRLSRVCYRGPSGPVPTPAKPSPRPGPTRAEAPANPLFMGIGLALAPDDASADTVAAWTGVTLELGTRSFSESGFWRDVGGRLRVGLMGHELPESETAVTWEASLFAGGEGFYAGLGVGNTFINDTTFHALSAYVGGEWTVGSNGTLGFEIGTMPVPNAQGDSAVIGAHLSVFVRFGGTPR